MNKQILAVGLCAALLTPMAARAATVEAANIPDGTYTVVVNKIVDNKHIQVSLDRDAGRSLAGNQTLLSAGRDTVDFSKVKENDQLKLSIAKGSVLVFLDLTSH